MTFRDGNERLILGFRDMDGRSRFDALGQHGHLVGHQDDILRFHQIVVQFIIVRGRRQHGDVHIPVEDGLLGGVAARFLDFELDMGIPLPEYGHDPGQHLHGPLDGDSQAQRAVAFVLDVRNFMQQVRADGDDFLHCSNIFFTCFRQDNGLGIAQKYGCSQIFFHSFDRLTQSRLRYMHGLGSIGDASFLDDFHNILRMFQVHPVTPSYPAVRISSWIL